MVVGVFFFLSFFGWGVGRRDSCLDMFHSTEHSTVACIILVWTARSVKSSREERETLCPRILNKVSLRVWAITLQVYDFKKRRRKKLDE